MIRLGQGIACFALAALCGCAMEGQGPRMVGVPLPTGVIPVAVPASLPLAGPQADSEAKKFNVPNGKAALYIYRNEFIGSGTALPVFVDGRFRGGTAYRTYIYVELDAGLHLVASRSAEDETSVAIDAVPGQAYYVWQEIKRGWTSPRSLLHLVDESTGRAGVLESKLIAF